MTEARNSNGLSGNALSGNALAAARRIGARAVDARLQRLADAIARAAAAQGLQPEITIAGDQVRIRLPGGAATEFGAAGRPARPFVRTAIEQERAP